MWSVNEWSDLIQNDSVLPAQWAEQASASSGEVAMIWAVLMSALKEIEIYAHRRGKRAQRIRKEAWEWVEDERADAFSFVFICDYLGLEPDRVRGAIKKQHRRCCAWAW